ncbi:hypothetical protein HY989_06350 [Candidatus Micrarchaeota archaeon]|nr:hypothetical protein [Candidatus Micrarchaeota archaeon]
MEEPVIYEFKRNQFGLYFFGTCLLALIIFLGIGFLTNSKFRSDGDFIGFVAFVLLELFLINWLLAYILLFYRQKIQISRKFILFSCFSEGKFTWERLYDYLTNNDKKLYFKDIKEIEIDSDSLWKKTGGYDENSYINEVCDLIISTKTKTHKFRIKAFSTKTDYELAKAIKSSEYRGKFKMHSGINDIDEELRIS